MTKTTRDYLESLVDAYEFFYDGTLTIVSVSLKNGAQVVGQSHVVDVSSFDPELGRTFAYEDALIKLSELEGYAIKTRGS